MLNLDILNTKIQKSLEESKGAFDKKLVLVVGKTGAGKSTTVNYLLRHPLQMDDETGNAVSMDNTAPPPAVMGDSMESVTTYPTAYTAVEQGEEIVYCDCPGFQDNRSDEDRIAISISTEAVARRAQSIQGIMVIIESGTITAGRGAGLREVAQTLGSLFHQPKDEKNSGNNNQFNFNNSVMFVISKVDSRLKHKGFMKKIGDLIAAESKKLEENKSKLKNIGNMLSQAKNSFINPTEEKEMDASEKELLHLQEELNILEMMQANPNNVVLIDVFDEGQSREAIVKSLKQMKPIPKDHLNFNDSDSTRSYFCSNMTVKFKDAVALLKNVQKLPLDIKDEIRAQEELNVTIERYKALQNDLDSGRVFKGEQDPIVIGNKENIRKNTAEITAKTSEVKAIASEINDKTIELYRLDTDEQILFYDSVQKRRRGSVATNDLVAGYSVPILASLEGGLEDGERASFPGEMVRNLGAIVGMGVGVVTGTAGLVYGLGKRIELDFEYHGGPFTNVEENYEHGEFKVITNEKNHGKYKAHYESDRGRTAKASVKIYGEKRNLPANKTKIDTLKSEKSILEASQAKLQKTIAFLETTNTKLANLNHEFLINDSNSLTRKKIEIENLLTASYERLASLQEMLLNNQELLAQLIKQCHDQKAFWDVMAELSQFMEFNDQYNPTIVQQFHENRNWFEHAHPQAQQVEAPPAYTNEAINNNANQSGASTANTPIVNNQFILVNNRPGNASEAKTINLTQGLGNSIANHRNNMFSNQPAKIPAKPGVSTNINSTRYGNN